MIIYDNIVQTLQSSGGISVYFDNLIDSCRINRIPYTSIESENSKRRLFERYRDCLLAQTTGVFHSSYYRLPSQSRLKVVTTVHDFTYERFVKGPRQWIHTWQKNRSIQNSDIIICVSNNTAQDLMKYCPVDESRVRIIYNGVSRIYQPLPYPVESTNAVLFVGARGGYKNFLQAVKAVSSLSQLNLRIVGGGELTASEVRLLNQLLPGRYIWLGKLSDERLNEEYNHAYALIYPSAYEGFGIPIIEAMRAGCPVVAINVSSIPEVAGEAAVLVDFPSVDNLVYALNTVALQRKKLVSMGFKQAEKFSWTRCFEETLAVYNELV